MRLLSKRDALDIINRLIFSEEKDLILFVFESDELVHVDYSMNAGIELCAKEDIKVGQEPTIIPTGLKWAVNPMSGYFGMILPRSGLSKNTPLRMPNSVGTIEASYRHEIGVLLQSSKANWWKDEKAEYKGLTIEQDGTVFIPKGSRVAQFVVSVNFAVRVPEKTPEVYYVVDKGLFDHLEEICPTKRAGGFGSTGVK